MMNMARLMMSMPSRILTGVEGSRPARFKRLKSVRSSGVRARMKKGSKDW